MKKRYLFLALVSIALAFGFTACSDDEDKPGVPTPMKKTALTVDMDTVQVGVGESTSFTIKDGGGDYKVINEIPEIASGEINGNVVTVTGQKKGITGIVISDAAGGYKRVLVKSMYFKIDLDKTDVAIGIKLGHTDGSAKVSVIGGNGGYTWESKDPEIAKVRQITDDGAIIIQGVSVGSTEIKIMDMMGLSRSVSVTVSATEIPFTDEEKAEIMKSTDKVITWDDQRNYNGYGFCTIYGINGGRKRAEWDYYGYWYCRIDFTGDLSAGKKTDGRLVANFDGDGESRYDSVDVEILKREGGLVWGVMSVVKDDYLHTGYFIVEERN